MQIIFPVSGFVNVNYTTGTGTITTTLVTAGTNVNGLLVRNLALSCGAKAADHAQAEYVFGASNIRIFSLMAMGGAVLCTSQTDVNTYLIPAGNAFTFVSNSGATGAYGYCCSYKVL
jgi:hypothetical protein